MATSRRLGLRQFPRLRLLVFGALAIILCLFIAQLVEPIIYKWRLRTVEATYGTEESVWRVDGFIVRTEEVVEAPAPGRVTLLVGEGRRVRAGDPIVELVNDGSAEPGPSVMADLNRRLNQVRAEHEAEAAALVRQQRDLDDALNLVGRALNQALASGNQSETQRAIEHRDAIIARRQSVENQLSALREQFERTEAQLLAERGQELTLRPSTSVVVAAPRPGVISFALDGYEAWAPGDALTNAQDPPGSAGVRVQDGAGLSVGDPLFRLVDLTAPAEIIISSRHGIDLRSGTRVEVVFDHNPNQRITGRLVESMDRGREWVGRIHLDYPDQSLVHRRQDGLQLIARRAEGIVVPARAIYESEGRTGVYVMFGDQPVYREVTVLGGNDRRVVINAPRGVPVGAPVVLNPSLVAERSRSR